MTSATITSAPSRAQVTAWARPCPRAPPVMRATLPSSIPIATPVEDGGALPHGPRIARIRAACNRRADMRALAFQHSLAREAASAIGGRVDRRAFVAACGNPAVGLAEVAQTPQVR